MSIQKSSSLRHFWCHFQNWNRIQDRIKYSTFNSDSTFDNNLTSKLRSWRGNSQEFVNFHRKTPVFRISFLIKLQAWGLGVSWELCEISKNTFSDRTPLVAACPSPCMLWLRLYLLHSTLNLKIFRKFRPYSMLRPFRCYIFQVPYIALCTYKFYMPYYHLLVRRNSGANLKFTKFKTESFRKSTEHHKFGKNLSFY